MAAIDKNLPNFNSGDVQMAPQGNGITNPALKDTLQGMDGATFLGTLLPNAITLLLIVAGVVLLFILIIGGIRYMLSGGDKAQAEAARGQLTSALIGIVLVFSAFAIINLIGIFFGINLINIDLSKFILK